MGFLSPDSSFMTVLNRITDMIVVNVLFFLCCLPLVTYGSAKTSLYEVASLWQKHESAGGKEFLVRFKRNFKAELIPGLIPLGLELFLIVDLRLSSRAGVPLVIRASILVLFILFLAWQEQFFLLGSRFTSGLKERLKNGVVMTVGILLRAVFIGSITGLPLLVALINTLLFLEMLPLWFLFYYAGAAWLAVLVADRPYSKLTERFRADREK